MAEPHPDPNAALQDGVLELPYSCEAFGESHVKVIFSLPYDTKFALFTRILAPLSRTQIDDICTTGLQQGHTSVASEYLEWQFLSLAHAPTELFKILCANEANIDLLLFAMLLPLPSGNQNENKNQLDNESCNYPVLKSFPWIDDQGFKRQAIGIVSRCWGTERLKRTVYPLAFCDALGLQSGQVTILGKGLSGDFDSEKSDRGCYCPFGSCDCCDSDCSAEHEPEYRGRGRSRPWGEENDDKENENEDSYNGTDTLWNGGIINTTEFDPAMASAWRFDLASHSSLSGELETAAATSLPLTSTMPTTTAPSSSTSLSNPATAACAGTSPRTIVTRENNAYEHFQKKIGKINYDDGLSLIVARNALSARIMELYKREGLKETKVEGAATAGGGGNSGHNSSITAGSSSVAEAGYDWYIGDFANYSQIW